MKVSTILTLMSVGFLALKVQAAPVGMAAHVTGNVTVVQNDRKTPLRLLGRLEPGATINCGPNSSAVIVLFKNGSRFQIGAGQRANVGPASVTGAQKLAALSVPSASAVKLLGEARVGAVLARPATSVQRLTPFAPDYIDSLQPRFNWIPVQGASQYTFTLFDKDDNVIWSTTTSDSGATYPSNLAPLLEKEPYLWKLSAFKNSTKPLNTNRWGLITLLSSKDGRVLDEVAVKLREQAKATSDDTPLLLLVETYRSYGVLNSALELLTGRLVDLPGANEATSDVLDSLSPFARVQAGRPVPPINSAF